MIHGFRGTHHGLSLIARGLRRDYTVIVPDLPGFGEGETLTHYSLDAYVQWLHLFVKKQHLTAPPIILGHSFGSIITAAYAARYPRELRQLILVNPIGAPALEGPKRALTKLAIFYYRVGTILPERAARRWLASKTVVMIMSTTMAKTTDKARRAFIHDQHRQHFSTFHSAQSVSEAFQTSVSHTVGDFARRITVPTLLIAGALDDITPLGKQFALVKLFPQATLKIIDQVGHLTHYETPAKVAQLVRAFTRSA